MIRKKHPSLLPNVIQAIADLCEKDGSSKEDIMKIVKNNIHINTTSTVNCEIRKAVKHGTNSGILTRDRGRYRVSLTPMIRRHKDAGDFVPGRHPSNRVRRGRRRHRRVRGSRNRATSNNSTLEHSPGPIRTEVPDNDDQRDTVLNATESTTAKSYNLRSTSKKTSQNEEEIVDDSKITHFFKFNKNI